MNTRINSLSNDAVSNMLVTDSHNSGNTSIYGLRNSGNMQIGGSVAPPSHQVDVEQSIYDNET